MKIDTKVNLTYNSIYYIKVKCIKFRIIKYNDDKLPQNAVIF